jgi:2-polyprenyl-6-methoxyphenol hydroxylase-like FAD-dependent oxidoreductase
MANEEKEKEKDEAKTKTKNATSYDVIVVGARCAGAPVAMLLARKGYKALLVDRATFPSDTLSTHVVQPWGVARLARWGLLDRLVASGCPPTHTYVFNFGPLVISGSPGTAESPVMYCPRRTVLDKLLVDAAVAAGAELREGFAVDEVLISDGRVAGIRGHGQGGTSVTERAPLIIGADGRHSLVARAVTPEVYNDRGTLQAGYYAYWSNLPMDGRFDIHIGDRRGFGAADTHDGLTMVVGGWPFAEFETNKHDHERHYMAMFDQAPAFRDRLRAARRESKVFGAATPNFFRKPYGPGWALVGDAGYIKDPITAQGISDAFRDAELVTDAIDAWRSGTASFEAAMAAFQSARDAQSLPMYDFTCQLATLEPPPPETVTLLGAVRGNQHAMDQFCRVNAGTLPPPEFFAPSNIARIFAAAGAAARPA